MATIDVDRARSPSRLSFWLDPTHFQSWKAVLGAKLPTPAFPEVRPQLGAANDRRMAEVYEPLQGELLAELLRPRGDELLDLDPSGAEVIADRSSS